MKPTIKSVAELAGVSFKTVSRVINNEPSVGEELRERVWKAVKELNYQPNLSARQLRGASSFIGFIYDNPNSHYVIEMQKGILGECSRQGFQLVIHPCNASSKKIAQEILELVERGRVAGLVLTPPISENKKIIKKLHDAKINFVRVLSGSGESDGLSPCVFVDDRNASVHIVQHLIDLGHKRIAFLAGDENHISTLERLEGYKEALEDNGIAFDPELVLRGEYSFESGVSRTQQLLAMEQSPTAVFACNDEIAAGTLFAARLMGVDVPANMSIAGFEDSPFSRQTWPKLTTARQPTSEIAAFATSLLIQSTRSTRKGKPQGNVLDKDFLPELVVRDSTTKIRS